MKRRKRKVSKKAASYISRIISHERRKKHKALKQAIAIAYAKARRRGFKIPRKKR